MPDAIDTWLAHATLPLDTPEALAGVDLEGMEVVFLGEFNHFVHEKSDFRTLFARALIARGFDAFGEELGWSDGVRLTRYFEARDETVFDRLALFGWNRDKRQDRDDMAPVFAASAASYPSDLMRAEQTRFYRALSPRAYFGLDIAADASGGYGDLAPLGEAALARVPGESIEAEIARLQSIAAPQDAHARASLAALIEHMRYLALLRGAKTYAETAQAMAYREDAMKKRFADARTLAGGKLTLMAHALHLAKNDSLIAGASPGVGPGGGTRSSLGHHIAQELGLRVFSIWFLYGAGDDCQPLPDLPRRAEFPRDSLNARLARRFNEPTLIHTRDAPRTPMTIGHMYNSIVRTTLPGQVDALYFLPRVTPMRLDDSAPH